MTGWHSLRFTPETSKVEKPCGVCGRIMYLPPSKAAAYKCCSTECNAAARKAAHNALVRPCETCGTAFRPRPVQVAHGGGRFCSQKCNTAGQRAVSAPDAQLRAVSAMRSKRAAGEVRFARGPDHPHWKGGVRNRRPYNKSPEARDRERETQRAYRKAHPDKVREFSRRRSGKKLGRLAYGTIPRIGAAQGWRCAICRACIKTGYHMDHILPLARGGEHVARNIQLLCQPCNLRKSARDPIDHMRSLGRLL